MAENTQKAPTAVQGRKYPENTSSGTRQKIPRRWSAVVWEGIGGNSVFPYTMARTPEVNLPGRQIETLGATDGD